MVSPFDLSRTLPVGGRRSLEGYSPWGRRELDTTERLVLSLTLIGPQVAAGSKN